ncbi:MAG: serine acetyltransferase [Lentisphaerae bacterium]|nr:serine acetyltransferase [Lentisphaerota bacterium]
MKTRSKKVAVGRTKPVPPKTAASAVAQTLFTCNRCTLRRRGREGEYLLPSRRAVHEILDALIGILFPGCHGHGPLGDETDEPCFAKELAKAEKSLREQVGRAFRYRCEQEHCVGCGKCGENAAAAVDALITGLPSLQETLQEDIEAAYEGDPAANSAMEVVMSYPAIQAIAAQRIAHVLYDRGVPLIPRIMTELAHSRTGIDIHPGAKIGRRFFIDHGTGVVIGETAVIGNNVKLYQGVTLGALSFPKGADGKPIKGIKRHPEVRDNVTIYAEATILGGDTVIGEGSEIGGNVWLTHSVPARSRVHNRQPAPHIHERGEKGTPSPSDIWYPVI